MSNRRDSYKDNKPRPTNIFEPEAKPTPPPPPKPNPIMLVNEIGRLWHRLVEDGAPEEFRQKSNRAILRELSIRDGVYQLDLSESTHLKPPTISVTLRKLEESGIIFRAVDPMDLRATKVYLTEKGHETNAKLHTHIKNADEIALQGLTEEEKATLLSLLSRVKDNLAESDE